MNLKSKHQYTERTLCRIKSQINHFMRWLLDEEIIELNPLHRIKFRQNIAPKRSRVLFSEEELRKQLEWLKEYSPGFLYPFIYMIAHTGARRGEIQKLTWDDLDFATRLISFRQTKNGSTRQVRMSVRLYEALRNHPKRSQFVFTDELGQPIHRGKLQRRLQSFKKRYPSEKDWRCHDLRHSFAYNFLKRGGEMYQLKAILGHKTIQMTVDLYGNLKAADVENPSPFGF